MPQVFRLYTAYEMIVSVGNMEERIPEELSYEILTEFVEGWKYQRTTVRNGNWEYQQR